MPSSQLGRLIMVYEVKHRSTGTDCSRSQVWFVAQIGCSRFVFLHVMAVNVYLKVCSSIRLYLFCLLSSKNQIFCGALRNCSRNTRNAKKTVYENETIQYALLKMV